MGDERGETVANRNRLFSRTNPDVRMHSEYEEPARGPLAIVDEAVVAGVWRHRLIDPRRERMSTGADDAIPETVGDVDELLDLTAEVLSNCFDRRANVGDYLNSAFQQLVLEAR
jgi:hypothetical protein